MGHWVRARVFATAGCVVVATLTACSSGSEPSAESTATYPAATMASSASAGTQVPTTSTAAAPTSAAPTTGSGSVSTAPTSKSAAPASTARPKASQPTVPADVPRTGPNVTSKAEKPPVMPIAATKHTAQGAKAFAEFFVKTIDWGYATTDSKYMRHYFDKSCSVCNSIALDLDNTASAKHHYLGDRIHVKSSALVLQNRKPGPYYLCRIVSDVDTYSSVTRSGRVVAGGAAIPSFGLNASVTLSRSGWTVTRLERKDAGG